MRLSGPLAGWRADRALPDYQQIFCNACRDELLLEDTPQSERRKWAAYLPKQHTRQRR